MSPILTRVSSGQGFSSVATYKRSFIARSAGGAYQIARSLRFNSPDSAYLSRTPASAGNRKIFTLSLWVKLSGVNASYNTIFAAGGNQFVVRFTSPTIEIYYFDGSVYQLRLITSAVYRDPSAWFHYLLACNTDAATSSDRVKLYINGSQVTSFSTATYPSPGLSFPVNNTVTHYIGTNTAAYLDAYLADCYLIDGQALDPTSFTEVSATTGQLIPKQYTGSFGTNGFWLKFSDNSAATATTLGKDYSSNGNNWTPNNLSVTAGAGNDSLVDTPTSYGTDTGVGGEVRGNYCTWNPLSLLASATTTNGNLDATTPTTNGGGVFGTIAFPSSGKWYFEVTPTTGNSSMVGISDYLSTSSNAWAISPSVFYWNNGKKYVNGVDGGAYGATYTTNDIIGVAVNCDSGSVTFYKNNSSQGAITCTPGGLYPCLTDGTSSTADSFSVNFGQRPFAYTAPSGFKALCDTNLPAPTIAKPNTVMDVVLYTGTGSALTPTSSLGFNPDLVWIKSRSAATDHAFYDVVRGVEKRLESNNTDAEVTSDGGVTAFNSNGFSVGTLAQVNTNTATYAGWCWDGGTSTVTNTQGSITSSVRANASAGFSIVTYTSSGGNKTVGHGLGVAPALVIVKNRSISGDGWAVYHSSIPATQWLRLNTTSAATTDTSIWNSTAPTSGLLSFGSAGEVNSAGGYNYVAYCFAPVSGYSSFGSYVGNGDSSGPFIWTGFRPRWILFKSSSAITNWVLQDTTRFVYNQVDSGILANTSAAEYSSGYDLDILSNGFKIRRAGGDTNASSATYIYAAFAESPLQYSRAR